MQSADGRSSTLISYRRHFAVSRLSLPFQGFHPPPRLGHPFQYPVQIQNQVRLQKVKKELVAGVGEDAVTDDMWAVAAREASVESLQNALEAGDRARQELGVCLFCYIDREREMATFGISK